MTPSEMAEFRELAGLNEPKNTTQFHEEWAKTQLVNQPNIVNNLQIPNLTDYRRVQYNHDTALENLASRLNSQLGSDFASTVKIERLN
jgi:hypothetical protein